MITAIENRHSTGLLALLQCACKLVEVKRLNADDSARLDETLGDLMDNAVYGNIDFDSKEATSISLVRAECVRLAQALKDNGLAGANATSWLDLAAMDPLPEVRFALAPKNIED